MKVKDLIEELEKLDPEMGIVAETEHGNVEIEELTMIKYTKFKTRHNEYKDTVLIRIDYASAFPYEEEIELETRIRLNNFRTKHNSKNPYDRLNTAGCTIDFLIKTVELYQKMVSDDDFREFRATQRTR